MEICRDDVFFVSIYTLSNVVISSCNENGHVFYLFIQPSVFWTVLKCFYQSVMQSILVSQLFIIHLFKVFLAICLTWQLSCFVLILYRFSNRIVRCMVTNCVEKYLLQNELSTFVYALLIPFCFFFFSQYVYFIFMGKLFAS